MLMASTRRTVTVENSTKRSLFVRLSVRLPAFACARVKDNACGHQYSLELNIGTRKACPRRISIEAPADNMEMRNCEKQPNPPDVPSCSSSTQRAPFPSRPASRVCHMLPPVVASKQPCCRTVEVTVRFLRRQEDTSKSRLREIRVR